MFCPNGHNFDSEISWVGRITQDGELFDMFRCSVDGSVWCSRVVPLTEEQEAHVETIVLVIREQIQRARNIPETGG